MADDCSRLDQITDAQLLDRFNTHYPQQQPWQLVHLRPEMMAALTSALRMIRPDLTAVLNEPPDKPAVGGNGKPSLPLSLDLAPTVDKSQSPGGYLFSKFLPPMTRQKHTPPAVTLSALNPYRTTYGPVPRRSPAWGPAQK